MKTIKYFILLSSVLFISGCATTIEQDQEENHIVPHMNQDEPIDVTAKNDNGAF